MQLSRRFTPDFIGIFLALAALAGIIITALAFINNAEQMAGSIYNQDEDGTSLFAGWLIEQEYQVGTLNSAAYPLSNQQLLFILSPKGGFSRSQLTQIKSWLSSGGTLIVAQERRQPVDLPQRFGLYVGRMWPGVDQASLQLPALNWPLVGEANVQATHRLRFTCGQVAIHIGNCNRPIMASFGEGLGQVFYFSTAYPFTNAGLTDRGNAQLLQNLVLATAAPGSTILFDEWHQRLHTTWIIGTAAGWGLIFALLVLTAFFLWHNVLTDKPAATEKGISDFTAKQPGDAYEYITAMAIAQQELEGPRSITAHYWQRLKRQYGRRYGLDPALPDDSFMAMLKDILSDEEISTIIHLSIAKNYPKQMANELELRHWVSTIITLLGNNQELRREIYEYPKTSPSLTR
jgi:hypothetical protein